jgi:drug/metabolite transporter (DMT)-like permease
LAKSSNHPAVRAAVLALLAAALFGASTPFVQYFGTGIGPWITAALLYIGAALAALTFHASAAIEAPLRRVHLRRLACVALLGAMLGPFLLAWGLQSTSAMSGSLVLTLEAVFTVLLAIACFGEAIDRRVGLALIALTAGGVLLVVDRAQAGTIQLLGLLAVVGATLAWALDNTLSRPLADLDPGRVVLGKALIGSVGSVALSSVFNETWPGVPALIGLLATGAIGYGLSLRFYLLAQRSFGAARTGSVFATAPFVGALIAFGLGDRDISGWLIGAVVLMVVGVALHVTERHAHEHRHVTTEHEHAHTHDDGHHGHSHDDPPEGAHSHWHHHDPVVHAHSHTPDLHHTHEHR